jgi:hypothetical protein
VRVMSRAARASDAWLAHSHSASCGSSTLQGAAQVGRVVMACQVPCLCHGLPRVV